MSEPIEVEKRYRYNSRYDAATIENALRLKISGKTYPEVATELGISEVTLNFWVRREKSRGSELGKLLCSSTHDRNRLRDKRNVAKHETIKFPGGSEYTEGNDGKAVLVEGVQEAEEVKTIPIPAVAGDVNLVDAIFEELALKIGRQQIEIISLKTRLKKVCGKS
jgi:transposase